MLTIVNACVPSTVGAQAAIWPCSVAKMKGAAPVTPFSVIEKSVVPLNTMPDGVGAGRAA